MIYLDSSAALAQLLAEEKSPPKSLAQEQLTASRLVEYEIWNILNARGFGKTHQAEADELIARIDLIDLSPAVLARALEPFPVFVRTLDALHLATIIWLIGEHRRIQLASYDKRMIACAEALGVEIYPQ